ncbi:probable membrane-associated kinase regulator 4 [Ipomoea triloba]|uniref:probable membrane-associated kinase regulator 4 n=1 Tax=Ipomoea triloba TaxID=35885 RepID=UPI00125CDEF2|nr:probable membrane-associated kinase regulator 4 [Ipomoea triloba]
MQKSLLPMNIYMQKPFLPINSMITMQRPLFLPTNISMQRNFHFSGQTSTARNNHVSAAEDDEYIDIEVNSFSPKTTDFEFQMPSSLNDKELTVLPADDLFYKGKLLPLLLPPRLQTVQNLLKTTPIGDHHSIVEEDDDDDDEFIIMEFASSTPTPWENSTSGTPVEPFRLSFSLTPAENFKRSTCLSTSIIKHQEKKHSWLISKLRLFKKSLIGNRGKGSRVCSLRSFFRKSACINVSSAMALDYNKHLKAEQKKTLFGHIGMWRHPINREGIKDKVVMRSYHRRPSLSFSSAEFKFKGRSFSSSSSSFSSSSFSSISFSSRDFYDELNSQKRSCSFTSDIDGPIEAAIAHCKTINTHP